MIGFFRRIRKKLADDNQFLKYSRYAIGEVLLVVIGILIAVQINSWVQNKKRVQLESVLLKQLKYEMLEIYDDIYSDHKLLKNARRSHYRILDYIKNDVTYQDSMCFDFAFVQFDEYIYPKEAVFDKIKEEGLDIIRNDSIRYLIQSLYESTFPRLSRTKSFHPDISEIFDTYYLENFKRNTDESLSFSIEFKNDTLGGEIYQGGFSFPSEVTIDGVKRIHTGGFVPLDFESLKKDTKFHMLLQKSRAYRDYKIRRYGLAIFLMKKLIEKIDNEL